MASQNPRSGTGVRLTRPTQQAHAFCDLITNLGGNTLLFPTIEIEPREHGDLTITDVDILVVTSSNAVAHGRAELEKLARLASPPKVIAVGDATAKALQQAGYLVDHVPAVAGSEGVLSLDIMHDPAMRSVVILRGLGGRNLLPETLAERGMRVTIIEIYRRVLPSSDTTSLVSAWRSGKIDVVTVHSREALLNLDKLLGTAEKNLLRGSQLVVPTSRMVKLCEDLAITSKPVIANSAEDDDMFEAVLDASRLQSGHQEQS